MATFKKLPASLALQRGTVISDGAFFHLIDGKTESLKVMYHGIRGTQNVAGNKSKGSASGESVAREVSNIQQTESAKLLPNAKLLVTWDFRLIDLADILFASATKAGADKSDEQAFRKAFQGFVARAKDKNDSFRLMGFGHRVYKNFDPRAKVMRETCHDVLKELNIKDPLLDVAMELERIALSDPYFIEKKLYPNVDFYSGIILKAIGIPTSMFTVIFAMSRTVGWISHWDEMLSDKGHKIGRPRQLYTGYTQRDFVKKD